MQRSLMHNSRILITEGMCQNTKNMKITPVTDICSKDDFVKKKVLTPPLLHEPL